MAADMPPIPPPTIRTLARLFAAEGAALALTDIDRDGLCALERELREGGASVVAHPGDVAAAETHGRLVELATSQFGALHGWCNIAGVLGPGLIEEITVESFDRVMHVNCLAQLLAIQKAAPAMRSAGGGAIVNVSSVGALVSLPHMTAYCASKAAVLGLTRAVAAELAPDIRCNAVCPGGIESPMSQHLLAAVSPAEREGFIEKLTGRQHMKRFAQPEEIAPTLLHLVSDESRFTTGATYAVDAGHSSW